jgi:hypothetical protein
VRLLLVLLILVVVVVAPRSVHLPAPACPLVPMSLLQLHSEVRVMM